MSVAGGSGPSFPPGKTVSLTVIRGPDSGTKFEFHSNKVTVGRKRGDLVLRDRETSGLHASIEGTPDGRFILKDLGSTNGTFLDGRRVTIAEISSGQQVKCGANSLLFTVSEEDGSVTSHGIARPDVIASQPLPPPATPAPPSFGSVPASTAPPLQPMPPRPPPPLADFDLDLPDLPLPAAPPLSAPAPAAAQARPPVQAPPPPRAPDLLAAELDLGPATRPFAFGGREPTGPDQAAVITAVPLPEADATPPPRGPAGGEPLPSNLTRSVYGLYLIVERGRDKGSVFPLNSSLTVIGRSGTDVVLNDPDISRRHAALDVQGQAKYVLRDLSSTNGTLLNGIKIEAESVGDNDKIRMGGTTMKFVVGDGRVASELRRLQGA